MLLKNISNNSLDVTLTQALIVISISVLYNEYIILLQQVSHNLNSIQKTVTQECCTTTIIITQQSHTDNMNWELIEHIIVTTTETEERKEHNKCQKRKWQNVI
jgi:ribosomal silencing factor RsfS